MHLKILIGVLILGIATASPKAAEKREAKASPQLFQDYPSAQPNYFTDVSNYYAAQSYPGQYSSRLYNVGYSPYNYGASFGNTFGQPYAQAPALGYYQSSQLLPVPVAYSSGYSASDLQSANYYGAGRLWPKQFVSPTGSPSPALVNSQFYYPSSTASPIAYQSTSNYGYSLFGNSQIPVSTPSPIQGQGLIPVAAKIDLRNSFQPEATNYNTAPQNIAVPVSTPATFLASNFQQQPTLAPLVKSYQQPALIPVPVKIGLRNSFQPEATNYNTAPQNIAVPVSTPATFLANNFQQQPTFAPLIKSYQQSALSPVPVKIGSRNSFQPQVTNYNTASQNIAVPVSTPATFLANNFQQQSTFAPLVKSYQQSTSIPYTAVQQHATSAPFAVQYQQPSAAPYLLNYQQRSTPAPFKASYQQYSTPAPFKFSYQQQSTPAPYHVKYQLPTLSARSSFAAYQQKPTGSAYAAEYQQPAVAQFGARYQQPITSPFSYQQQSTPAPYQVKYQLPTVSARSSFAAYQQKPTFSAYAPEYQQPAVAQFGARYQQPITSPFSYQQQSTPAPYQVKYQLPTVSARSSFAAYQQKPTFSAYAPEYQQQAVAQFGARYQQPIASPFSANYQRISVPVAFPQNNFQIQPTEPTLAYPSVSYQQQSTPAPYQVKYQLPTVSARSSFAAYQQNPAISAYAAEYQQPAVAQFGSVAFPQNQFQIQPTEPTLTYPVTTSVPVHSVSIAENSVVPTTPTPIEKPKATIIKSEYNSGTVSPQYNNVQLYSTPSSFVSATNTYLPQIIGKSTDGLSYAPFKNYATGHSYSY